MWGRSRRAARESEEFFENTELWRRTVWQSHQFVHLLHAGAAVVGPDFTALELQTLRELLRSALASPPLSRPDVSPFGYGGFVLADPFDDDRLQSLDDVPNFATPRPHTDVYRVADGYLTLPDGTWREAPEIERWLLNVYVTHGLRWQLEMVEAPLPQN